MITLTIENQTRTYPEGTLLLELAKEFQPQFEYDILLTQVNGKLQELHKTITEGTVVRFITAEESPGIETYRRSVTLIMLKAFFDVAGADKIEKITVDFSLGNGLFAVPKGDITMSRELLDRVKLKMQQYVAEEIPIMKRSVNTDEAVELFQKHKMYDKARLFSFRRVSKVNIYSIGAFEDYFYGYMVQNTGYIKYFDLELYQHGFVLLLPDKKNPRVIKPFVKMDKLFRVLNKSSEWGEEMQVSNVGELNAAIAQGRFNELILIQEALQESMLSSIADQIRDRSGTKFIMVAGPSSSGKTTFSHRLSIQLRAKGLKPHPIAVDNYFIDRVNSPRDEEGNYNFEALECIDLKQFNEDMSRLLQGDTVEIPRYNFIAGTREYKGDYLTLGAEDVLVIEGIHCLNSRLSYSLPDENKFKIYISALTQLNVDEHNRIPTTDGRLIRRMVRDARTRGLSAQETIRMWSSVRRGEEENIFPYQEEADVMFNSALVYELAVLKQYVEPLLFGIPKGADEYLEARRLLKFLDYFLGVSSEEIPKNSILREFIGYSCFHV